MGKGGKRNAPPGNDDVPQAEGEPQWIPKRRKLADEVTELKGLEIYWKLPSMDPAERQAAALALVKELQAAESAFKSKDGKSDNGAQKILLGEEHSGGLLTSCAPELQYALPRLVRGVGSSNQCARQGFAAALTTIIKCLPSVTSDSVLKLIDKEIEVSSSLKGQELRDGLIGRVFAYASIVQAGRLIGNGATNEQLELAKLVGNHLLTLALKRTFLREPAISVFLELVGRLSTKAVQKSVFTTPSFIEWLNATPDAGGADALLIALKVWPKLPQTLRSKCSLLPDSGLFRDLFQLSHLDVIVPYLKESSASHPRVHPVWTVLAEGFSDRGQFESRKKKTKRKNEAVTETDAENYLLTFWSRVVDEALLDSSHERKFLALQLVLLFLSKLPVSCIPIILSVAFGRCLVDILSSAGNHLYSSAQQFMSDLCKWAEENQDRLVYTIAFLQQSSFGKFDRVTKSSAVKKLMSKVTSEASCLLAIQKLQQLFVSDTTDAMDDSEDAKRLLASKKIWMVDLMCSFCKQASSVSSSKSAVKDVTRFLAAQALEINLEKSKGPLPKTVKDACAATLRALLSEKISNRKTEIAENEDLGYDLVEFFQPALKIKSGELEMKLLDAIHQITSAMKTAENSSRLRAMRCLLSQLLIQLCLEPGSVNDIATDLLICCKEEFGNVLSISVANDEEEAEETPAVADVLLDVVLSILSDSSAPIRNAAEQVFGLFCGDISSSGLSSILKIVTKGMGHSGDEVFFEIQDDDDDEDVVNLEDVDEDEDEEDDSDESDDDKADAGKQLTEEDKIQGAMDDAESSDMDDDAMFRIDGHLAQILKGRKRGDSDTQMQLLHFKFRVLGLLETFLHKQPGNALILTILPTLFQTYLHALTDENTQLSERITSLLSKVLKAKNYPKGPEVDTAVVKDLLLRLLTLASKTTDVKVRSLAQGYVFWLLKVSQAAAGSSEENVVEAMKSAVDDIFSKRKSKLPITFFQEIAARYPWLGKIVVGKLIDRCRDGRTDFEKAEAMNLLASLLKLYKKSVTKSSTAEEISSCLQPHLSSLSEVLKLYFGKPLKKAAHQVSFMRFCLASVEALGALFPGKPLKKVIDTVGLSEAVASFLCADKSKLKAFKAQLEGLLKAKNEDPGKITKRKKQKT